MLHNERLSSIGSHRYYYPGVLCVVLLWLIHAAVPWSDSLKGVEWTLYSVYLLALAFFIPIFLTQMDRRLMSLLFHSFEYGFLLSQIVLQAVCALMINHRPVACVNAVVALISGLSIISLDALAAGRKGKGIFLVAMCIAYSYQLLMAHLNVEGYSDIQVVVFFYRTTVFSLEGSATLTVILFTGKYLFHIVWRPGRMLILTSNIVYSLKQHPMPVDVEELPMHAAGDLNAALLVEK
jgi:hypothetical protein